jgi:hypothetical protein
MLNAESKPHDSKISNQQSAISNQQSAISIQQSAFSNPHLPPPKV